MQVDVSKEGDSVIITVQGDLDVSTCPDLRAQFEELIGQGSSHYAVGEVQLCEFGIGTNRKAKVLPTGPIFEKTFGTVHIGCGCNDTFGGSLAGDVHYDLIVQEPTVTLDGETVLRWDQIEL